MMRSLYAGITGLRNHQIRMDVIGNNISNVNTVGFKSSRVVFQDIYSQTLSPSSGSTATIGGTNPKQIGLGAMLATVDVLHTSTASQYTGAPLDLSIEGDGFFVLSIGGQTVYSRAGNFYTDGENFLVNSNGAFVQGYPIDNNGVPNTTGPLENIILSENYYDITIDSTGAVVGLEKGSVGGGTNEKVVIGQIAVATFSNQNALEKVGQNSYRNTINSGVAVIHIPGEDGAGTLNPGTLEMSNVDLASEFTDMIVTQRGFQANSRIITTTDAMLEELVNLKR